MKNESFTAWQDHESPSLLWIKGAAGQGKTTLAKFILNHLEIAIREHDSQDKVIYFFFYNQENEFSTMVPALRSLISQLISTPGAFQTIEKDFDLESPEMPESFLWKILEELLRLSKLNNIYCVIDAVDECQGGEPRERLLSFLRMQLAHQASSGQAQVPVLKVLLLSRPTIDLSLYLEGFTAIHLKADPGDLASFIDGELRHLGVSPQLGEKINKLLANHVEETFLWISIALRKIKARITPLTTLADIKQLLSETPSDLSALYEAILDQIIQNDHLPVLRLLGWVAFGRRALSLDELNEALAIQAGCKNQASLADYKSFVTKDIIINAAGTILDVGNDDTVYLIHQSAKDFLLKTQKLARATDNLHPDTYLAKKCMEYLCFEDFENEAFFESTTLNERLEQYPFLSYASRNWHRHIRSDDDAQLFASNIRHLTQPGSTALLTWGHAALISDLEEAKQIWDVAMKANIPWLADFQSEEELVTSEMVLAAKNEGVAGHAHLRSLCHQPTARFSDEAVHLIAHHFDYGMIHALGESHDIPYTPALLCATVTNKKHSISVLGRLLEEVDKRIIVNKEVIEAACVTPNECNDVFELLLRNENVKFSEDALIPMIKHSFPQTLHLLTRIREDIVFDEQAILAVFERFHERTVETFFEQNHRKLVITENITKQAARSRSSDVMKGLFRHYGQEVSVTEKVMRLLVKNERAGLDLTKFLIQERGRGLPMTEYVVLRAVENFSQSLNILRVLFRCWGKDLPITQKIAEAAVGRSGPHRRDGNDPVGVVRLLFKERGPDIDVTEELVKRAAGNSLHGSKMLRVLFQQRGLEVPVTVKVVETAALNDRSKERILEILFQNRRPDMLRASSEVIKNSELYREDGTQILQKFLRRHEEEYKEGSEEESEEESEIEEEEEE